MNGCVALHGFTGSPLSFEAIARALGRLRPRAPLLRPALLGHGAEAPGVTRFEQEVDRLARLVVARGFVGAHLCGYSLGARLALGLLARHAHLFSGATLIGVHPGLGGLAERAARAGSDERWCERLMRSGLDAFLDAWQAQPLFATQHALSPAVTGEQRRIRASHRSDGLARALRVLGLAQMPDYRGALAVVPVRVRLVTGALDTKFSAIARTLGERVPRVSLDVVAGVGHNLLVEAPGHVSDVLCQALAA